MKYWIFAFLVMPLVFVACADKSGSDNTVATVPPPAACMDGTTYCNSHQYGTYPGFSAYPYNPYYYNINTVWGAGGGYVGNFCNCPWGSRPVYNGQFGMGCVSNSAFNVYAGGAVYWGYGANNNQWVNMPQISNSQGYPQQNGCFQNVAQSCFVDQMNACGAGRFCQTTGGGSRLGICVAQGATNTSAGSMGGYR
jgi:hypothetical protein